VSLATNPGGDGSGGSGTTVSVSTAAQLAAALTAAVPGQTIRLANGTYNGNFVATASGTAAAPIILSGSRQAVLASSSVKSGYVLHLSGANYWQLNGFAVTGAQKGIVLDESGHDVINGVEVHGVGDEGIHLRQGSSNDLVENSYVHNTGLSSAQYGEGIYVGSAESNWASVRKQGGCLGQRHDLG
jgi:nitrous oxidase accessory protein NosD